MKADAHIQRRLLDLQSLDTAIDRCAHRLAGLPEHQQLIDADAQLTALADELLRIETGDADLARAQRQLEDDVDAVRSRTDRDNTRMTSGVISNPKELESLQSELETLARRQADLEEQILELMVAREETTAPAPGIRQRITDVTDERAAALARRDQAAAALDAEAATARAERELIAAEMPADLLALYEKIRADRGGIGAALLQAAQCQGCHISLAGTELTAIRAAAPDDVVRCDDCRRILVRTELSGL